MMYNEKLVAVVKVGGRVLRETNGTVYIPFNREYTIQLKNLNSEKAVVSIDIDGDNVTDNSRYIIHPGDTVEIEGFLKGNGITRKFKFLEKTQEISDFRGDDMEDGLIKFTYQFEFKWPSSYWNTYNNGYRGIVGSGGQNGSTTYGSSLKSSGDANYSNDNVRSVNLCNTNIGASCDAPVAVASSGYPKISTTEVDQSFVPAQNDNGITGRGSNSNQSFQSASVGFLDPKVHTMIIQLKGDTGNQYVETPIYTRTRLQCNMCGKKWPSSQEYCGGCQNSLR